jgi:hypothetical protein
MQEFTKREATPMLKGVLLHQTCMLMSMIMQAKENPGTYNAFKHNGFASDGRSHYSTGIQVGKLWVKKRLSP